MQFDSLLGALKTGKIDIIISGMTTTTERKRSGFYKTLHDYKQCDDD